MLLAPAPSTPDPASAAGAFLAPDAVPRDGDGPGHRWRWLAILAADVAGYSRMMEADELRTALRVRGLHQRLVRPMVLRHHGRIFSLAGDGAMVAFPAAADAVGCAVAIQQALDLPEGGDGPTADRLRLRMGISVGSVLVMGGELYGRALNVAARLEALAVPGGIYLSGAAFDQLGDPDRFRVEPLGERQLAKLATPSRVYRVDLS